MLKKLELLEKPEAHVFWAFGADVVLVATDRAGNTYHIDLPTWQEARQLAEDIHRASLAAEELDKGYAQACGDSPPSDEVAPEWVQEGF
jgi:hypothetical protein